MKLPAAMGRRQTPCRRGSGHDRPDRESEPCRGELGRRDAGGETLQQKLAGLRRL